MDIKKAFGKNLRAIIKSKGYKTVEIFAHENEFEKSWVYRMARGEREPGLTALVRLARALGVTLEDLYPMKKRRR
ncbi:MAG: helix-turn-helix transcriptional regulator [Fibrobacteria bacterium]